MGHSHEHEETRSQKITYADLNEFPATAFEGVFDLFCSFVGAEWRPGEYGKDAAGKIIKEQDWGNMSDEERKDFSSELELSRRGLESFLQQQAEKSATPDAAKKQIQEVVDAKFGSQSEETPPRTHISFSDLLNILEVALHVARAFLTKPVLWLGFGTIARGVLP